MDIQGAVPKLIVLVLIFNLTFSKKSLGRRRSTVRSDGPDSVSMVQSVVRWLRGPDAVAESAQNHAMIPNDRTPPAPGPDLGSNKTENR